MKKIELRLYNGENGIVSANRHITGYASVYEKRSKNLGGFVEIIKRGAFSDVLNQDVVANINHDENLVLARTGAGLTLKEDRIGLYFDVKVNETSYANDLLINLRSGAMRSCSFKFEVLQDNWKLDTDGTPLREIIKVGVLHDIAIVTTPAYEDTTVALRALSSAKQNDETLKRIAKAQSL